MRATLLVALVVLAGSAYAFPAPDATILDTEPFTDEGSVAWRMFLPAGSWVSFWMEADHADLTFGHFSLWFVDPVTYEFNALISPVWYPEGGHETHVAGDDIGVIESTVSGNAPYPIEMRVDFEPNSDREWLFVVTHTFDGDVEGEWRLYGESGATLLGSSRGDAFLHTERDFTGTANVIAREELPVREAIVEAKVQVDASVSERAENRMFASFWGGDHADLQQLSYTGPVGGESNHDWYLVAGQPAGDYEFRIDQNVDWYDNQPTCRALNAEVCWRVPAYVSGADIVPP